MKKILYLIVATSLLSGAYTSTKAQSDSTFTLEQSIAFALKNRASLAATRTQLNEADARIGEIRAMGLPQVNAAVEVGNNFIQQKTLIDTRAFGSPQVLNEFVITPEQINSGQSITLTPTYSAPEPVPGSGLQAITFVQPYTGSFVVTGSQLLFDGSYLIGLKAAGTYAELSRKNVQQSEIEVAEQVSKAYYGVLVNRERMALLNQNLYRLDTLLSQTKIMFQNGVAEKLDVDRLQVSRNNLFVEQQKTARLLELSEGLLKFQMGLPQQEPIVLTEGLAEVQDEIMQSIPADFDYSNRIEYSILETQRDLAELDLKNIRSGYLPKLYANARYGYNGVGDSFGDVMKVRAGKDNFTDRNWFDFGYVGAQLQIPIFDGLRRHYQIQQAKARLERTRFGFDALEQAIDLELRQASVTLVNALAMIEAQQENLELAEEIARVAKIKFQEGVGSNLEVVTAETELRQAQTNYYAALYDALIAKVDLGRAAGTLLNK